MRTATGTGRHGGIGRRLRRFRDDQRGMVTHFALTTLILVMLFAGMSLDSGNAWRVKQILQTAADAAAWGAVADLPDEAEARETALALATANLPAGLQGAITSDSIVFGNWDSGSRSFSAGGTPVNAVRVVASRTGEDALPTYLLYLAGFQSWNIQVEAVAYRSTEDCQTADITANGEFSITANNDFYNGFCVEAAGGLNLTNNNYFDDNNRLYVASFDDISWPSSVGMGTVVGRGTDDSSGSLTYADILRERSGISADYETDIDTLAASYLDPLWSGQPDYINGASPVITISASDVKYTDFEPGRVYKVVCGGSNGTQAQFFTGAEVAEVVIVSDCAFNLGKGASFEDVVLITKDTGSSSVYAASEVRLGADDDCDAGGGVVIYTPGGFSSAAKLELHDVTLSAAGDVQIAAQGDAVDGMKFQVGGDVSFTANADFGTCKDPDKVSEDTAVSLLLVQ